jgi:PAS domain S-box-containing protein
VTTAFPQAAGAMAERLRRHDWSETPLGPMHGWRQSLRTAVSLMLNARQPMFVLWGPERTFLYNDAYSRILGDRNATALGLPVAQVWPEIYDDARQLIDPAYAGQPTGAENVRRVVSPNGYQREGWYTLSYTPVHDEDGAVAGVFAAVTETTDHVRAQQRLSFLLRLSERLRATSDPTQITGIAAHELALELGVSRAGYGEVDAAGETMTVPGDWAAEGVASLAGRSFLLDTFGPEVLDELRAGRTLRIGDSQNDPRTIPYAEAYRRGEIAAQLSVGLIRGGRFTAVFFLHSIHPRVWTETEAALVEDVAARTWSALTRARAEAALHESESRFRAMADQAPAPIWMTSAAGDLEFANQAFGDYAGAPSDSLLGNVWIDMLHPDDLAGVLGARASARLTFEPYSFEARFKRSDGAWRTMLASAKPRMTPDGIFQGYVGLAIDLTEMRAAEAAMRESEARFRLLAESAPVMLWMGDEQGRCVYLNRQLRDFWGVDEDLTDFTWARTLLEEDAPSLFKTFGAAMAREAAFEVEARYRRADGQLRTLFTRAEPRHDAEGRFIGMIGVNVDVTEARRAEQHQQLLINELNHRVKNTLASVQSIAHQTLRAGSATREARDLLTARLLALSAAHDVLTHESWEGADLAELVAAALRPFEAGRHGAEGPPHRVGPRAALAISMALHELGTNALKYGALSGVAGQVYIGWAPAADGGLALTWREQGGPPVAPPTRTGFGSRLLRQGLMAELGGAAELRFEPGGLVCVIQVKGLD